MRSGHARDKGRDPPLQVAATRSRAIGARTSDGDARSYYLTASLVQDVGAAIALPFCDLDHAIRGRIRKLKLLIRPRQSSNPLTRSPHCG